MKILHLILSTIAFMTVATAWDCHPDCSGYEECLKEKGKRELEGALEEDVEEPIVPADVKLLTNLRGFPFGDEAHRNLRSEFQIKMYWQSDYCWQEEKRERKWCWECAGSSCNDGDSVQIQTCDSGDQKQKWIYIESGGKVRISPKTDTNLCCEIQSGKLKLKPCDSNDSKQLFSGFKSNGDRFELEQSGKLVSQEHDPKSGEELLLIDKGTARGDHTNYWQVYNRSGSGGGGGGGGGDDGGGVDKPKIKFLGSEGCTPSNKCSHCQGDCDSDDDCEGDLVCKQRRAFESFDECSGGGNDSSESDYCVEP